MKLERKTMLCLLLCAALLCAALSGCGKKAEETPAPAAETPTPAAETAKPTATPAPTATPEPTATPAPTPEDRGGPSTSTDLKPKDLEPEEGDGMIHSAGELIAAIQPGAEIVLAPGEYDLSLMADDPAALDKFNDLHEYVKLRNWTKDGVEIVITGCDGLTIRGAGEGSAEVQLVVQPRHVTVLAFDNCHDLSVSHMTMGHTPDRGTCDGSVIALENCADVLLDNLDLYGCGAFGVRAVGCAGGLTVRNSILRECEYGPFGILDCSAEVVFTGCALLDSDGGGTYEPGTGGTLRFETCEFGKLETEVWKDRAGVQFTDCNFGVITKTPQA